MTHDVLVGRRTVVTGALAGAAAASFLAALPVAASADDDQDALRDFRKRMRRLGARAVCVIRNGETVVSSGDVTTPLRIASIRKSVLDALFGMAVAEGRIDLGWTMADLGIDRLARLTPTEAGATVRQLLMSRSGVYLPAAAETSRQEAGRPRRGSYAPGAHWYYNNWDLNVLGRIYEMAVGEDVFTGVDRRLAGPLGWRDFNVRRHTEWVREPASTPFPAYNISLSARDMARFGQLYLGDGTWNGRRLLDPAWVRESTTAHSSTRRSGLLSGYGYLWWAARDWAEDQNFTAYSAVGNGGRYITVAPSLGLVIAVQPNERRGWPPVRLYADRCAYSDQVGRLIHGLGGPDLGGSCS